MNNKNHYNNLFRDELRKKINHIASHVFSRSDLIQDHSNQAQLRLNRALHAFIDEGIIIKIAHGLFAKSEPNLRSDKKWEEHWRFFLEQMVYQSEKPDFEQAISTVEKLNSKQ